MDSVVFLGKGGVGKTTMSWALSLFLAAKGKATHVVSLDPAHSLEDASGQEPLSDKPSEIEPGLFASEVDFEGRKARAVEVAISQARRSMRHLAALGLDSMPELLAHAPGLDEDVALRALHEILTCTERVVVVDTPATALALRMLLLPALSNRWLEALGTLRRKILDRRETIARIRKSKSQKIPSSDDPVLHHLESDQQMTLELIHWLASPTTHLVVVSNADRLSLREAGRIASGLRSIDRRPSLWVLNRHRGQGEPKELQELRKSFPAPVVFVPDHEQSPPNRDIINGWGEQLSAGLSLFKEG